MYQINLHDICEVEIMFLVGENWQPSIIYECENSNQVPDMLIMVLDDLNSVLCCGQRYFKNLLNVVIIVKCKNKIFNIMDTNDFFSFVKKSLFIESIFSMFPAN